MSVILEKTTSSLVVVLFCCTSIFAQLSFSENFVQKEFLNQDISQSWKQFDLTVLISNTSSDTVFTKWEVLADGPCQQGWEIGMSDKYLDYEPGIAMSTEFFPIDILPFETDVVLIPHVYPNGNKGCCKFKVVVSDFYIEDVIFETLNFEIGINEENCLTVGFDDLENNNNKSIVLFPNPVSASELSIKTSLAFDQVKIIDVAGQLILNSFRTEWTREQLNISSLSSGLYFLQIIKQGELLGLKRFIVN